MALDNAAELADTWIAHWQDYEATGQFVQNTTGRFTDLPYNDPDTCWRFIRCVLERIEAKPENPLFQVLAAGPLEDLLNHWGAEVIDRVEKEALRDPRFRQLLGGVWRSTIDNDIWSRVEACRLGPW